MPSTIRPSVARRWPETLLPLLYFVSGFLALVYEIVWIREIALVVGSTTVALSTVLGAFFGGLALGSFAFGRVADRTANPTRFYGALEVLIGLYAVAFVSLLDGLPYLAAMLDQFGGDQRSLQLVVRLALTIPLLIVPAALMGGTLPVLSRQVVSTTAHLSGRVGFLYAVNTAGGALGAFVAGFYAIYHLGLDGTSYLAAGINVAIGIVAWLIGKPIAEQTPPGRGGTRKEPPKTKVEPAMLAPLSSKLIVFMAIAYGVSGFTVLAYEVVWSRYLALFLVNSTYAYSTMLTVFLLGFVAGSILLAPEFDRTTRLLEAFGYLQLGIGISGLLALPILLAAQGRIAQYATSLTLAEFAAASVLMIVPTTLMGATFPLVAKMMTHKVDVTGRRVGGVYALGTVGGILGSTAAGFLLVPALGVTGSTRLLAGLNLSLGLAGLLVQPGLRRRRDLAVAIGVAALAFGYALRVHGRILESRLQQIAGPIETLVDVREGLVNTVWVTEDTAGRKALWTNMSVMGRTGRPAHNDLSAQRIQGHIPMLLHPGEPKTVLGIAFGTGQTFGAQLLYPIERLDAVDLSRAVVDMALKHFAPVQNGLSGDRRVRIMIDDGRAFVMRTQDTYDVVTLEMPPQEEVGVVHFYTREFYEALRRRLNADGVVAQWVPIYNITPAEARGIVRTFLLVFPEAALWHNGANLLLIGFNGGFRLDPTRVEERLQRAPLRSDLSVSYVSDSGASLHRMESFLASFLMGSRELAAFSRGATVYTDDRPELEFTWTQFPVWGPERKSFLILENIRALEPGLGSLQLYVAGPMSAPAIDEMMRLRRSYLNQLNATAYDNLGTYALARGEVDLAFAFYEQARQAQPAFAPAHNHLASLYLRVGRREEALAAAREAARLDPDDAEAHYNIGAAYANQGRTAEALAAYREAVRVDPRLARGHDGIGQLQAELGQTTDAIRAFEAAIRADPTYSDAYLNLAVVLTGVGDIDRAVATVRELLRRVPGDTRGQRLDQHLRQARRVP